MAGSPRQNTHRTLKVKCGTWDQVHVFFTRKVRADNRLPMRVPFTVEVGSRLSLALELPSQLVISIDGEVLKCQPAADGKKSAVMLELSGLTEVLRGRIAELVAEGRAGESGSGLERPPDGEMQAPAPVPADAPVFELVAPPTEITGAHVISAERQIFDDLDAELSRLKEAAAHQVLGVAWDADVNAIRAAYFGLTKKFHPDVYARYQSSELRELAQEAFIHINRAYDRMRDAAVEAGAGIIAGPALLPHDGWLVADWDDMGEQSATPIPSSLPNKRSSRAGSSPGIAVREPLTPTAPASSASSAPPPAMDVATIGEPVESHSEPLTGSSLGVPEPIDPERSAPVDPSDAMAHARELLAADDADGARALLARALSKDPRNRSMRALYHITVGRKLMAEGEGARAIAQYEAALAHDRECVEAREALESARDGAAAGKKGGLFKRLFR